MSKCVKFLFLKQAIVNVFDTFNQFLFLFTCIIAFISLLVNWFRFIHFFLFASVWVSNCFLLKIALCYSIKVMNVFVAILTMLCFVLSSRWFISSNQFQNQYNKTKKLSIYLIFTMESTDESFNIDFSSQFFVLFCLRSCY